VSAHIETPLTPEEWEFAMKIGAAKAKEWEAQSSLSLTVLDYVCRVGRAISRKPEPTTAQKLLAVHLHFADPRNTGAMK